VCQLLTRLWSRLSDICLHRSSCWTWYKAVHVHVFELLLLVARQQLLLRDVACLTRAVYWQRCYLSIISTRQRKSMHCPASSLVCITGELMALRPTQLLAKPAASPRRVP
jgi:hypothetical protein